MFSEKRIAQVAAYLLAKGGGRLPTIKLMKLMYLADRESLRRWGHTISEDVMGSMDNGPVLSRTLDYIHGEIRSADNGWDSWIADAENYEVRLQKQPSRRELDEVSDAAIEVLDAVWGQFGGYGKWDLVEYTHKNCPEWRHPQGTFIRFGYQEVLVALGVPEAQAAAQATELNALDEIDGVLARI